MRASIYTYILDGAYQNRIQAFRLGLRVKGEMSNGSVELKEQEVKGSK